MVELNTPQAVQAWVQRPEETPVGPVGPFQVSLRQEDLEQVVVIRGQRSDALGVLLRRLGLDVREEAGVCYVRRDDTLHEVLVELFELVCALQYLRPHFGQLEFTIPTAVEVTA